MAEHAVSTHAVDVKDLESRALELVDQAAGGEEVVLTRNGEPIAKLIPFTGTRPVKRRAGSAKGLIEMADDFDAPLEDFREYM